MTLTESRRQELYFGRFYSSAGLMTSRTTLKRPLASKEAVKVRGTRLSWRERLMKANQKEERANSQLREDILQRLKNGESVGHLLKALEPLLMPTSSNFESKVVSGQKQEDPIVEEGEQKVEEKEEEPEEETFMVEEAERRLRVMVLSKPSKKKKKSIAPATINRSKKSERSSNMNKAKILAKALKRKRLTKRLL